MKKHHLVLILLTAFSQLAVSQETKNIIIKGIIKDQKSTMPLASQIKIIYKDIRDGTDEIISKGDGSFEVNVLPHNLILQAKTDAYIVSNIVLNLENLKYSTIIIEIPLVFNAKSKINELLLDFTHQKNETEHKKGTNKQVFQAIDAADGKIIAAQFRLIDAEKKDIITTKTSLEQSVFEHNFNKKEKIAVEVLANGYQKFLSEILIDNFDETVHENTAKLIKNISFLNLKIDNESELQNINVYETTTNTPNKIKVIKKDNIYFGMLAAGNIYKLAIVSKKGEEITKEFVANEGINQFVFTLEASTKKSDTVAETEIKVQPETKVIQVEKQTYKADNKDIKFELQTIFFERSSTTLSDNSKEILERISQKMLDSPDIKIEITGHTDNIGDTRQNLYLSEFRAKVIYNYLFNKGIKENRISIKGNGSTEPKTSNDTEENRTQNRRAELRFY